MKTKNGSGVAGAAYVTKENVWGALGDSPLGGCAVVRVGLDRKGVRVQMESEFAQPVWHMQ